MNNAFFISKGKFLKKNLQHNNMRTLFYCFAVLLMAVSCTEKKATKKTDFVKKDNEMIDSVDTTFKKDVVLKHSSWQYTNIEIRIPSNVKMKKEPIAPDLYFKSVDTLSLCDNDILKSQTIDLGLGVCWSGWNFGATSPIEYGICLYKEQINDIINPPLLIIDDAPVDVVNFDTERKKWEEDGWRLPANEEIEELLDRCEWQWFKYETDDNVIFGYKVTGPSGKYILLPATGWVNDDVRYKRGESCAITSKSKNGFIFLLPNDSVKTSQLADEKINTSARFVKDI